MATKTKAAAKVSQAKQPKMPEVLWLNIDLIDTKTQVRTEMDETALQELAQDIAVNGILQNLIVAKNGKRFTLIAGHRRLAAARIAGRTQVPARLLTTKQPELVQLAENIQREDLSLQDMAQAIRRLYDKTGSVQEVAELCHKSKAWVSKRLSVTFPTFGYRAQNALEEGYTADLEILKALSDVEALDHRTAEEMFDAIKGGKMTRAAARNWLTVAKKRIAERDAKEKAKIEKQEQARREREAKPQPFSVHNALWQIGADLNKPEPTHTADNILAKFTQEQRQELEAQVVEFYKRGQAQATKETTTQWQRLTSRDWTTEREDELLETAWLAGFLHQPWKGLPTFLGELRQILVPSK